MGVIARRLQERVRVRRGAVQGGAGAPVLALPYSGNYGSGSGSLIHPPTCVPARAGRQLADVLQVAAAAGVPHQAGPHRECGGDSLPPPLACPPSAGCVARSPLTARRAAPPRPAASLSSSLPQKVVNDGVSSASVLERLQNFQHKDANGKDLVSEAAAAPAE